MTYWIGRSHLKIAEYYNEIAQKVSEMWPCEWSCWNMPNRLPKVITFEVFAVFKWYQMIFKVIQLVFPITGKTFLPWSWKSIWDMATWKKLLKRTEILIPLGHRLLKVITFEVLGIFELYKTIFEVFKIVFLMAGKIL